MLQVSFLNQFQRSQQMQNQNQNITTLQLYTVAMETMICHTKLFPGKLQIESQSLATFTRVLKQFNSARDFPSSDQNRLIGVNSAKLTNNCDMVQEN